MKNRSEKPILLTGSTGFVGTHTARQLVDQGCRVRCLVRKTSDVSRLPSEAEQTVGHLMNYESLKQAVKGCQAVIHVGGIVRARQPREFYLVNRDGTANLTKAAVEAGVGRFVLCSSQAAAGPSTPDRRRRWADPPNPVTEYGKSKLSGEEALQKRAGDMWYCIIRPPAIYGPFDYGFYTLVRWIKWGFKLKLGAGKMPIALIHVADLARVLTLALAANHPSGAVWFATDGGDHTLLEINAAIENALGKRARWITIPEWVAPGIASVIELVAGISGGAALLSRNKLNELTQPAWTCDDTPFREATGFKERFDLYTGWQDTVDWYRANGWI